MDEIMYSTDWRKEFILLFVGVVFIGVAIYLRVLSNVFYLRSDVEALENFFIVTSFILSAIFLILSWHALVVSFVVILFGVIFGYFLLISS
ncbi:MAG: hypothetical protein WAZ66_03335 [Enterococcus aquimarinus]